MLLREPPYKSFTVGILVSHFYEFAEWDYNGKWLSALHYPGYLEKLDEMTAMYGKPRISQKLYVHTLRT